jgi:large subunit ribosomal protein L29
MAVGISPGELRELTDEELTERLRESKEELFNLRFQVATGQLDNNRRLQTVRHDIARIYTVMRERELGIITLIEDSGEPEAQAPTAADDSAGDETAEEAGR